MPDTSTLHSSNIFNLPNTSNGTITTNDSLSGLVYDSINSQLYWQDLTKTKTSENYYPRNELFNVPFYINFSVDSKNQLTNNILKISDKYFKFNCNIENNLITPYEYIMELIEDKIKMDVKVEISDILNINYSGLIFTKIKNNFSFDSNCNFSILKVKFKYDKILYENKRLTDKQKRTKKLQKILKNNE